ncbi:YkvA family protein [Kitasatospora sp. NPDC057223]|uniref:YkvA family protein n=1 Tax=Kitasatospora sp. NPDC057223 TaxID=3346055 RepID=UPI00363C6107
MDATEWFWWSVVAIAVVATVVVAVRLTIKLVRARRLLGASNIPMSNKVMFWAAIAYLVSPVDLLPDPVLLDDIGFLLLALRSLHKAAVRVGAVGPGRPEA